jgi:hypothetical protein
MGSFWRFDNTIFAKNTKFSVELSKNVLSNPQNTLKVHSKLKKVVPFFPLFPLARHFPPVFPQKTSMITIQFECIFFFISLARFVNALRREKERKRARKEQEH